jgi:hypothetical protein
MGWGLSGAEREEEECATEATIAECGLKVS